MNRLHASLDAAALCALAGRQVDHLFPDGEAAHADGWQDSARTALGRLEHCFAQVSNRYFFDGEQALFDHLHGDQYAMWLYLLANQLHRDGAAAAACKKLFLLNKALHGCDIFYEVELPSVFLLVHPLGTVLGRARYADHLLVYQRVGVGSNHDIYPVLGERLTLRPGSSVLGRSHVGRGCSIAAESLLLDCDLPDESLYIGNPRDHVVRSAHTPPIDLATMMSDDFDALRARLHRAIPGGAHTYSRGDDQFPALAPPLFVRGQGAFAWDSAGQRYLDYGMALRAVTLGYADARVNAAAAEAMDLGVNLTRASMTELLAAETLIDLIPSVEMVKFAKNGSNVTTAAAKIARAYTGRRYVCIPRQQPFFSFDDWFIGATPLKRGIPAEHTAATLLFDYNDLASLRALFEQHPGKIAAVMLEPATTVTPCATGCTGQPTWARGGTCAGCPSTGDNFLKQVETLCRADGALFILDEMITGFRWHLQGAQTFFGVRPDLCTFGKGMANGFSVAAIGGRREVMAVGSIDAPGMERTFLLSTTHGAEMPGLAAFMKTVEIYRSEDVVGHLWRYGERLAAGLSAVAARHGLARHFVLDGPPICLNYVTRDASGAPSLALRTLFAQELLRHGVLMPWIAVCQSHCDAELALTLDAADAALRVYARALDEGVERHLQGPAIRPVFRSHN